MNPIEFMPGQPNVTLDQAINWLVSSLGIRVSEAVDIINEWINEHNE